jgi:chloramphenicol 3-O phosphotransferase
MSTPGKIILLSGPSSAGKSTLSKDLQAILDDPYWHVSLDMIWFMLPPQRPGANWYPEMAAHHVQGFSRIVAALTALGVNVIAETGFLDRPALMDFVNDVPDREIVFVGVFCALDEIERREGGRDDRDVGYSRVHYDRVHSHSDYDIRVDTSALTPEQAAAQVKAALAWLSGPGVLARVRDANGADE